MRSLLYIFVLIIMALSISTACSSKPEKQAVLSGRVTASDTTVFLSGVLVREDKSSGVTATTDENGYFYIYDVPIKDQLFIVEKDGYQPDTVELTYNGNLNHPLLEHNIRLYKIGEEKPVIEEKEEPVDSLDSVEGE